MPLNCETSPLAVGIVTICIPLWALDTVPSHSFVQFFSWSQVVSSCAQSDQQSIKYLSWTLCRSPEWCLSYLVLYLWLQLTHLPTFPAPSPLPGSVLIPPSALQPGWFLQAVGWDACRAPLTCFPFLRDHCPLLLDVQCLGCWFMYFCLAFQLFQMGGQIQFLFFLTRNETHIVRLGEKTRF